MTFTKYAAQPECWIYNFRHILLKPFGRVVPTVLPDGAHTHVSSELAENSDLKLTAGRRDIFEPLGCKIANCLEQAFAYRHDGVPQSVLPSSMSST